ncbi:protein translocase subunit SecD [Nonomuraea roseoviolacea subsp. roseoviolacea]|uniref:Protein translocase subunit SecD n=1 Tax=Nonomuraea roseoviolacea subsp. carminata TaxID=160689 RepID=A0ABT1K9N1_9ACTN|nr:protein translocase subunit SecD [Nonomuraea roseoviolacea]MCP2350720.1 preprotein translocase subunit SecD [Nonomuraea roseoviolacea subsp. carminata]
MARPTSSHSKPGRTLLLLLALILALGGTMFLQKAFTPKLGLDLAGGTTLTLTPVTQNGASPPEEILDRAVNIIRDRVNGNGISDAEVAKSGDNIIISIPGVGQNEAIGLVSTTAELRFRQVLAMEATQLPQDLPTQAPTPGATPSGSASPKSTSSAKPQPSSTRSAGTPGPSVSPTGKALSSALTAPTPTATGQAAKPETTRGAQSDQRQQRHKGQDAKATPTPAATPSSTQQPANPNIDTTGIDPAVLKQFQTLDCTDPKKRGQGVQDDPNKQYAACESDGSYKYVLDKAKVVGTDIDTASAGVRQGTTEWLVQLDFKSKGASTWATLTGQAVSAPEPRNKVAVVLDGVVITAPNIISAIPGGRAEITGGFDQKSATDLAEQLKYGALPLKFNRSSAETVSSTLGQDQLQGGLIAGVIGLALVVVYSLLYYRGLGIVAVLSLVVATILTYTAVVVLGHNANFRLSLPHIIGLVVSIGITADSFIVYFERIRDEMKEGRRTLRAAVEVAWVRARRTILIADAVMFIAAVVLYALAVGGVAGFAFAMGLTTLIDIVVVFLFTKPFIAMLARLKFFAKGHPLSGLDSERMSADHSGSAGRTTTPQEA